MKWNRGYEPLLGEKLNSTVILFMNTAAFQTCSPKTRISISVLVEEFSSFSQVADLHKVKDATLLKQLLTNPLGDVSQHLSGTLAFSHGFQTPIPVQQLKHGHQLLNTKTHITRSLSQRSK